MTSSRKLTLALSYLRSIQKDLCDNYDLDISDRVGFCIRTLERIRFSSDLLGKCYYIHRVDPADIAIDLNL